MTLIASFEANGYPLLLGDILVTYERAQKCTASHEIAIPLLRGDPNLGRSGRIVARTTQKVIVPHPHLCMAWAGIEVAARGIAKDLRQYLMGKAFLERDDLRDWIFQRTAGYRRDELDLIFYWKVGDSVEGASNIRPIMDPGMPECRIGGSGDKVFINHLNKLRRTIKPPELSDYQWTRSAIGSVAGLMGAEQRFNKTGLDDGWGGAFEMVQFDGNRFRKVGPTLFFYWIFDRKPDGSYHARLQPDFTYHYYSGEDAVFWIDQPENNLLLMVTPIDNPPERDLEPLPEILRPYVYAFCFTFSDRPDDVGCYFQTRAKGAEVDIQIIRKANNVSELQWSRHLLPDFFEAAGDGEIALNVTSVTMWGPEFSWPSPPNRIEGNMPVHD